MLEAESRALSSGKNYDRDFASLDQVKPFLQILREIPLILVGLEVPCREELRDYFVVALRGEYQLRLDSLELSLALSVLG